MEKLIVVIEGPSGVGKDAIMEGLEKLYPHMYEKIVSVTTRPKRPKEVDGKTYFFVDDTLFKKMIHTGEIFEYTERHGTYRGMSKGRIQSILNKNRIAIKDCDMVGIKALKENFPNVLTIFIKASREEINERLLKRGDNDQERWARLKDYDEAIKFEKEFDYSIINKDLEKTIEEVHCIIKDRIEKVY